MSYWPFVTVFISLILILLFRRLDKRIINFHKFKRYADKLMTDFSQFLKERKQELDKGLQDVENAVQRATALIERIEEAGETLKDRSLNIERERGRLQGLKGELDRLGTMKAELESEVKELETSLPSLRKLSGRIKRIGIEAAENEQVMRNVSALIPSFEKRVDDRTQKAIEDVTDAVVEEAKGIFSPLLQEYRFSLDQLQRSHEEELGKFKRSSSDVVREAGGKVDELMRLIGDLDNRIVRVGDDRIAPLEERVVGMASVLEDTKEKIEAMEGETTQKYLLKAEEGFKDYIKKMEEYTESLKENLFGVVEERGKDLSTYITRLEGRVEGLLADIKKETDKYGEVLELQAKAQESEQDILKSKIIAEINEEANRNLVLIKPVVSEMNEKLVSYKREFSSILEEVKSLLDNKKKAIDEDIEGFNREMVSHKEAIVGELDIRMSELKEKLLSVGEQLSRSVDSATKEVSEGFSLRLDEYERRVVALEGSIGNLRDIARTGQRMIEERIEKVFFDYSPEIEAKIKNLKQVTEDLISQQKELIVQQIEEIVKRVEGELDGREKQIEALLEQVGESVRTSNENLRKQETSLMESVDRIKLDAREELVRELESLKEIFREEGYKQLERYREDLEGLRDEIADLSSKTEGIHGIIDTKLEEALRSVDENVQEMEKSYLKTEDEIKGRAKQDLGGVTEEIDGIRETVRGLKEGIVEEVQSSLSHFKGEVERSFEDHRRQVSEREAEILRSMESIAESTQARISESHKEAEAVLGGFEKEVENVQSRVEHRTSEIEKRIATFEKESITIKRAVRYKEKVEEEIEKLIDLVSQVKEDKKDIMSLRKVIGTLKRDEGDISARVRQLKGEKKAVSDIAKNAEQAIGLIAVVEEKLGLITSQKELLESMEEGMKQISERFESLEQKTSELGKKESDLEVSIETITKMKDLVSSLEQRTDLLKESMVEIKDIEEDIKKRVESVDEKSRSLMGNENRVEEVLSRFREMDSLVADIEARTNQLQTTRQWLARTESRLTNLAQNAERLVDELSNLTGSAAGTEAAERGKRSKATGETLSKEAQNKVKTVLTLFEQKWTIPEICKVTKMSRGEVELILELNNR
jgi:DNA repair exonuclease SbcCD ATPase subunit